MGQVKHMADHSQGSEPGPMPLAARFMPGSQTQALGIFSSFLWTLEIQEGIQKQQTAHNLQGNVLSR